MSNQLDPTIVEKIAAGARLPTRSLAQIRAEAAGSTNYNTVRQETLHAAPAPQTATPKSMGWFPTPLHSLVKPK